MGLTGRAAAHQGPAGPLDPPAVQGALYGRALDRAGLPGTGASLRTGLTLRGFEGFWFCDPSEGPRFFGCCSGRSKWSTFSVWQSRKLLNMLFGSRVAWALGTVV